MKAFKNIKQYRSKREQDGTWTIFNVPLFSEVDKNDPDKKPPIKVDARWQRAVLRKALIQQREGYLPPLVIGHQELFNLRPRHVGFVRIRRQGKLILEGQKKSALFGDLMGIDSRLYQKIKQFKYAYLSAEIPANYRPEIFAVALLTEAPHFPFSLLGRMKEESVSYNKIEKNSVKTVIFSNYFNKLNSLESHGVTEIVQFSKGAHDMEQDKEAKVIDSKLSIKPDQEEVQQQNDAEQAEDELAEDLAPVDFDDRFDRLEAAISSMAAGFAKMTELFFNKQEMREHATPEPQMVASADYSKETASLQGKIDGVLAQFKRYEKILPSLENMLEESKKAQKERETEAAAVKALEVLEQSGYPTDVQLKNGLREVFSKAGQAGLDAWVEQFKATAPPDDDRSVAAVKATSTDKVLSASEQIEHQRFLQWKKEGYLDQDCSFERFLRLKEEHNKHNQMRGY